MDRRFSLFLERDAFVEQLLLKIENQLRLSRNRSESNHSQHEPEMYYLESFQILGKHAPFLPFCLVVKLGCMFLGSHQLALVEFYSIILVYFILMLA